MKSYAPRSTYRSGSPLTGILLGLSFGAITALVLGQIFLMPADNAEIQRGSVGQQIAVTPQNNVASVPVLPTATLTTIPATPIVAVPAITPTATVPAVIEPNKDPLNFWYSEFFNNPDLEGRPSCSAMTKRCRLTLVAAAPIRVCPATNSRPVSLDDSCLIKLRTSSSA